MKNIIRKITFAVIPTLLFFGVLETLSFLYEKKVVDRKIFENEITAAKEDDEFRVFVAGGSTVQGMPVPEIGFVSQLRYYLQKKNKNKKINIINQGYTGQTSSDIVKTVASIVRSDPDLIIVLTAHNEFLRTISDSEREVIFYIQNSLKYFAMTRVAARVLHNIQKKPRLTSGNYEDFRRGSAFFKDKMEAYRRNIETISLLSKKNNVPLFLLTAPSNVLDWPPRHIEDKRLENVFNKMKGELSEKEGVDSRKIFDKYQEMLGDEMAFLYLKGKYFYKAKDWRNAKALLLRAKDYDTVPFRALSIHNEIIRNVASNDKNTTLIDIERIFEKESKGGVIGFDLIADNCHPTPRGNFIIARAITRNLKALLLSVRDFEAFCSSVGYFLDRGTLRLKYLLENGKYGMIYPFTHYKIARKYLLEALRIDAENWEVLINIASTYLFENNVDEAIKYFRKAYAIKNDLFDSIERNPDKTPFIKRGLEVVNIKYKDLVWKTKN